MSFSDTINQAITDAMRQKDAPRLSALRMLKAALMNKSVEKGRDLSDEEGLAVTAALVKQRRDSIEQFSAAGRQDLVEKEEADLAVLSGYLPPAADAATIDRAVADAMAETGASSAKDMGRVMKAALARLGGVTVDGKAVSDAVRRALTGA